MSTGSTAACTDALLEKVKAHHVTHALLVKEVKAMVQDMTLPLATRWQLFTQSQFGYYDPWCISFKSLQSLFPTSDEMFCFISRVSASTKVSTKDIHTALEQYPFASEHERLHTLTAFQEEVLRRFLHSVNTA